MADEKIIKIATYQGILSVRSDFDRFDFRRSAKSKLSDDFLYEWISSPKSTNYSTPSLAGVSQEGKENFTVNVVDYASFSKWVDPKVELLRKYHDLTHEIPQSIILVEENSLVRFLEQNYPNNPFIGVYDGLFKPEIFDATEGLFSGILR